MKRIVSLVLVVLLVASLFVGCSGASLEGVYKVQEIDGKDLKTYFTEQGAESGIDLDTVLSSMGLNLDTLGELMSIELKGDGKAVVNSKMSDETDVEGTWKQDGDKITITIDGDDQDFTLKDGKLVADIGGMSMTLGK